MSELREAMALAAALPKIQQHQIDRLLPLLKHIPISHLADIADSIEKYHEVTYESLMRVKDKHVRVAVWYVDAEQRCQHKSYNVGNVHNARIGNIGDSEWVEGWIA
jgi:hypothetical protein